MQTAALCISVMALMLSLMWGAANFTEVGSLQRQLDDRALSYEGEMVLRKVNESGLQYCTHELEKASAKLEMVDKVFGLTAKRQAAEEALNAVVMCGKKPCK